MGLGETPLAAHLDALVNREVVVRHQLDSLLAVVLDFAFAQDFEQSEQHPLVALRDQLLVVVLVKDPVLTPQEHRAQELVARLSVVSELVRHKHVVGVEPLLAEQRGLGGVHGGEVNQVLGNQLLHPVQRDPRAHASHVEEVVFDLLAVMLAVIRALESVLDLLQPCKHVCLNCFDLEEQVKALLQVASQLVQIDFQLKHRGTLTQVQQLLPLFGAKLGTALHKHLNDVFLVLADEAAVDVAA